ncbi:tetratricopeptide repeat protein [Aestuariivirga sp.]|uniref:tetratricopeptide repeat protein n=1 Tax=Aestuariivirga sp. TaxID=2650926 RepID=UPI0035930772
MTDIDKDKQDSIYGQAVRLHEDRSYDQAFVLFKQLAENGYADGCSMLATMYGAGLGTEFDLEASIAWDLKAIELGSLTSVYNLGVTHRGRGNCREARKWFEKSIASGDGDAMLELAKLLDVSDHETPQVIDLLMRAMSSRHITEDSREEAEVLLNEISNRPPI